MKLFVTGASGWIGSAVVPELMQAGHQVIGLARSDASAETLQAAGVEVIRGDLDDIEALERATKMSDGVIHLAFKHDQAFSGNFQAAAEADRRAVEVFGNVLAGSDRPLVIASGLLGLKPGELVTENDGHGMDPDQAELTGPALRLATAEYVLSLADKKVRASIVRLSPTNHGDGDHGFMATIVKIAQDSGVAAFIGDGTARRPAVHRLDSAKLFRLAAENAPAGTTLHAADEEGVSMFDIAETIGKQLNIPIASITPEKAQEHFTWLASFLALDSPASSKLTRSEMHWEPMQLGLLADLEQGHYFKH